MHVDIPPRLLHSIKESKGAVVLPENIQATLFIAAQQGKSNTYSPYSHFPVGAAVLTESGRIFTGCNVENASYGGAICAERTAFVKAVSEGERKFVAVAVCSDANAFTSPCGFCRQFMVEFGKNLQVYLFQNDGSVKFRVLKDLIPDSFGPENLEEFNAQVDLAPNPSLQSSNSVLSPGTDSDNNYQKSTGNPAADVAIAGLFLADKFTEEGVQDICRQTFISSSNLDELQEAILAVVAVFGEKNDFEMDHFMGLADILCQLCEEASQKEFNYNQTKEIVGFKPLPSTQSQIEAMFKDLKISKDFGARVCGLRMMESARKETIVKIEKLKNKNEAWPVMSM